MDERTGAEFEHRGRRYRVCEAPLSEAPAHAPRPMVTRSADPASRLFAWTSDEPAMREAMPDTAVVWHLWVWEEGASGNGAGGAWRYVANFMTKRALHRWTSTHAAPVQDH